MWSQFLGDGHLPSPGIVSWWDGDTPVMQDSVFDPSGHAWHVDRQRFDRMLLDAAALAGAEPIEARLVEARLDGKATAPDRWCLELMTATRVQTCVARLLIIATGRATPVAPGGVTRHRLDRLVGIGVTLSEGASSRVADRRTWIEASPAGWWYSAPTPGNRWTFTFFTDADRAPAREGRGVLSRYWSEQLAQAPNTERRLAGLDLSPACSTAALPGVLSVTAADSYRRLPCQGAGWLAAGDAAAAWDPLCGQGIEQALRSASRAARAADRLLRAGKDAPAVLAAYAAHEEEEARQYRERYDSYYGQMRRWPDAVFWQRRRVGNATTWEQRQ